MAASHADTALTPPSTPPTPTVPTIDESAPLSDVFSTSRSPSPTMTHPHTSQHPTDIPRLRATHVTAGYRAGISTSKESAVQPGFDEGYPLGATFGVKVGYLLGVLEGIVAAAAAAHTKQPEENGKGSGRSKRVRGLLVQARKELCVEAVFGKGVWKSDGTWAYSVLGEERGDVAWREVVEAHPIIKKWSGIVEEEMSRAGLAMGRFQGSEWEAGRIRDDAEG